MTSTHEHNKPGLQFIGDLVPNLVDKRARLTPNSIYSEYPISPLSYDEGYRTITYGDFANAVNGAARWLQTTLGPGQDFETLAYMGPNDLRYPALILGAVKAGYKVRVLLFKTDNQNTYRVAVPYITPQQCRCPVQSFRATALQDSAIVCSTPSCCDCHHGESRVPRGRGTQCGLSSRHTSYACSVY